MPISDYQTSLRDRLGHDLLVNPAVAAVTHDEHGQVPTLRHSSDQKWSLPAGAVEPGETPERAVVRSKRVTVKL